MSKSHKQPDVHEKWTLAKEKSLRAPVNKGWKNNDGVIQAKMPHGMLINQGEFLEWKRLYIGFENAQHCRD
ncbi:hypothetical protein TrVGV298_004345 [Trichoderma virens]|nr:hypothetical protein TrVGV298_004345 [Trichoderma virens]